jgi:hypothetical protein
MAAALCYGVGGGGAQLCFHVTPGNYDTDTLIEVSADCAAASAGRRPRCCGTAYQPIAVSPCAGG